MRARISLIVLFVLAGVSANADPLPGARWTEVDLQDAKSNLTAWKPGRVTVFSFFAYWCDTWKTQTPRLRAASEILNGLPIDLLTVSIDGRWREVDSGGPSLRVDSGGTWSRTIGIDRVPTTVVVDRQGTVRWVRSGVVRTEEIVREAKNALAGAPPAGEVYLTFDDFPPPSGGEEFLDLLRSLDVKATLFCVGERVQSNARLLRRALAEGHTLGCHSWGHDATNPQLGRCHTAFRRFLGVDFSLVRLPGSERIAGATEQHPVVDPFDYLRPGTDEIVRRCLLAIRPGTVVQLHAGVSETDAALPKIVESLKRRGFRLTTLP